jgi:hypothetical protein
MKRLLIFMLILFTGLMAYGGQSVNGPGIRDDLYFEDTFVNTLDAAEFSAPYSDGAVPVNGSVSAIFINDPAYDCFLYEASASSGTPVSKSDIVLATYKVKPIGTGGVVVFDDSMQPGQ